MSIRLNTLKSRVKVSITVIGYTLLALFLLMLTYMTYEHGGGVADWKSIITLAALTMVFLITAWLAVTAWQER